MIKIDKSRKWTQEELDYLANNYYSMDTDIIAEQLNRSRNSIKLKANRIGLKKPHHEQDDFFFDSIDNPIKAYWLGFITADGYVVDDQYGGTYELSIELSNTDEEHLYKFKKDISSNANITNRKKSPFVNKGYDKEYTMSQIRIYSKHLVKALSQYNVVQNKTYSLSFPEISDEYVWDYIRGYFDGDGCINIKGMTTPYGKYHEYSRVSFVCKRIEFLESLKNIFEKHSISSYIVKDRDYYVLHISAQASVGRFFNCIYYDDSCVRLDRKYNHFINFYERHDLPA